MSRSARARRTGGCRGCRSGDARLAAIPAQTPVALLLAFAHLVPPPFAFAPRITGPRVRRNPGSESPGVTTALLACFPRRCDTTAPMAPPLPRLPGGGPTAAADTFPRSAPSARLVPGEVTSVAVPLPGGRHFVPEPAVEVEVVAPGLAGSGVGDVGVQRVPVVGELV